MPLFLSILAKATIAVMLAATAVLTLAVADTVNPVGAVANGRDFQFLDYVNQERTSRGMAVLGMSTDVQQVAEEWSAHMKATGTLAHRPMSEQVTRIGAVAPNWQRLGENVGYGYDIWGLHNAFMNSSGHRANVLGDYTHVGIGSVQASDGRIWVTFNFVKTTDALTLVGVPNPGPAPAPPALVDKTRLNPLTPSRILDTRHGIGRSGPTGDGTQFSLQVAGRGGVPADPAQVEAVILNVTVTQPTGPGHVTVWPSGAPKPKASNLNVQKPGQTIANQVLAAVGDDGRVNMFTSMGTHLVADVTGWFSPASTSRSGRYVDVDPSRLLDTRRDLPSKPAAGSTQVVPIRGRAGVPSTGVSAVVINLTLTQTSRGGFATAYGAGLRPPTSSINADRPGQTIANQVIIPVGADGSIRVYSDMATHLVVDVLGWFTDETAASSSSGLFVPVRPYRAVDTRDYLMRSRATGQWDVDLQGHSWRSVAVNVTIVDSSTGGYVTVWGNGAQPGTSTVNSDRGGQVIPNAATVNADGQTGVQIYTGPESHVVIDVAGFYLA